MICTSGLADIASSVLHLDSLRLRKAVVHRASTTTLLYFRKWCECSESVPGGLTHRGGAFMAELDVLAVAFEWMT